MNIALLLVEYLLDNNIKRKHSNVLHKIYPIFINFKSHLKKKQLYTNIDCIDVQQLMGVMFTYNLFSYISYICTAGQIGSMILSKCRIPKECSAVQRRTIVSTCPVIFPAILSDIVGQLSCFLEMGNQKTFIVIFLFSAIIPSDGMYCEKSRKKLKRDKSRMPKHIIFP